MNTNTEYDAAEDDNDPYTDADAKAAREALVKALETTANTRRKADALLMFLSAAYFRRLATSDQIDAEERQRLLRDAEDYEFAARLNLTDRTGRQNSDLEALRSVFREKIERLESLAWNEEDARDVIEVASAEHASDARIALGRAKQSVTV